MIVRNSTIHRAAPFASRVYLYTGQSADRKLRPVRGDHGPALIRACLFSRSPSATPAIFACVIAFLPFRRASFVPRSSDVEKLCRHELTQPHPQRSTASYFLVAITNVLPLQFGHFIGSCPLRLPCAQLSLVRLHGVAFQGLLDAGRVHRPITIGNCRRQGLCQDRPRPTERSGPGLSRSFRADPGHMRVVQPGGPPWSSAHPPERRQEPRSGPAPPLRLAPILGLDASVPSGIDATRSPSWRSVFVADARQDALHAVPPVVNRAGKLFEAVRVVSSSFSCRISHAPFQLLKAPLKVTFPDHASRNVQQISHSPGGLRIDLACFQPVNDAGQISPHVLKIF